MQPIERVEIRVRRPRTRLTGMARVTAPTQTDRRSMCGCSVGMVTDYGGVWCVASRSDGVSLAGERERADGAFRMARWWVDQRCGEGRTFIRAFRMVK